MVLTLLSSGTSGARSRAGQQSPTVGSTALVEVESQRSPPRQHRWVTRRRSQHRVRQKVVLLAVQLALMGRAKRSPVRRTGNSRFARYMLPHRDGSQLTWRTTVAAYVRAR